MNGYIKLHRKLTQWEWYGDHNTFKLFIHCLLMANHKPNKWRGILIDTGEFVTSYERLKVETGLTTRQVRTSLERLQRTHEIEKKTTSKYSVIKVLKYCDYQTSEKENDKQSGSPATNKRQANDKQTTTNKNDKNDKNVKNDKKKTIYGEFANISLSDEEYEKIKEGNMEYLIEELSAYLESTGKKYKSHYATILNWSRKRQPDVKEIVPDYMTQSYEKKQVDEEQRKAILAKIKGDI